MVEVLFVKGRIIDVSFAGAKKLGMVSEELLMYIHSIHWLYSAKKTPFTSDRRIQISTARRHTKTFYTLKIITKNPITIWHSQKRQVFHPCN